ncbi:uncharacterized [Tachysurus ichikawai]
MVWSGGEELVEMSVYSAQTARSSTARCGRTCGRTYDVLSSSLWENLQGSLKLAVGEPTTFSQTRCGRTYNVLSTLLT